MDDQVRYRLPASVIEAVAAVARLEGVHPSTIIERAVRVYLGPVAVLENAASMVRDNLVNLAEIRDTLNVIADQSVDKSVVIAQLTEENENMRAASSLT